MRTKTILFGMLLLGQLQLFAKTATDYINEGRAFLSVTNIVAANNSFSNAVFLAPSNPTGNVFYAATRLLTWPSQPVGSNFLTRIGMPKTGRNIYNWTAKLPETNGVLNAPTGVSAAEFTAILRTNVLQLLTSVEGNLAKVTDTNFALSVTASETRSMDVVVDYGDIQMLRAMVQGAEFFVYTLHSWILDAQLTTVRSLYMNDNFAGSLLTTFPNLLTFATTNDASIARSTFQSAVSQYLKASELIRGRSSGEGQLFAFDANDTSEHQFRDTIVALTNSLDGAVPLPTDPSITVNMGTFFSDAHSPRSLLPKFSGEAFVAGTLPDPTLGGVVGGFTKADVENFLAGPHLLNAVLPSGGMRLSELHRSLNYSDTYSGGVIGQDGCFYAVSPYGGTNHYGSIWKASASSATTLVTFKGSNGSYPAGLVVGSNGQLYGTTMSGGTNGYGTIFKLTTNGVLTTLYSFKSMDGNPGELTIDDYGNFYGTTSKSGMFKMTPAGVVTFLFKTPVGGTYPESELCEGADGNFYGTTRYGGDYNYGTVFRMTPDGTLMTLVSFNFFNGANPVAGLIQAQDGNFYGTTSDGGDDRFGTVFKITTNGVLTTLKSFYYSVGAYPLARLLVGVVGFLYGTTSDGGDTGDGTVFKMTTDGDFVTLASFYYYYGHGGDSGDGGLYPTTGLIQGQDGDFYGTTSLGGREGAGTVYKITADGVLTTLAELDSSTGIRPVGLMQAQDGNFFGTTSEGGDYGYGAVFQMTTNGEIGILASFDYGTTGGTPRGSLVEGEDGSLYGTTSVGGSGEYSAGTIFRITPERVLLPLHSFEIYFDGQTPYAGLILGRDGLLYGTTQYGGNSGSGAVFNVDTDGFLTSIASFSENGPEGAFPRKVIKGPDGNFYGTVIGNYPSGGELVKITPTGTMTTLVSFNGENGRYPDEKLFVSNDGNLYGATFDGGAFDDGTVFKVTLSGTLTTLVSFDHKDLYSGRGPRSLREGFYGITSHGGGSDHGAIFTMTPSGTVTPIFWFGSATSSSPNAVVQANDGSFFGTTYNSIFRISTNASPIIVTQPASRNVAVGSAVTFSVGASGQAPLHYQWRKNGTTISGATNSIYRIASAQTTDAGSYSVVVTNSLGKATSANALLSVLIPPSITAQPNNQSVLKGGNMLFSVSASGSPMLKYQWRKNGTIISGASLSSYSIVNVQTNHAGSYSVVVSNAVGSVTSSSATLTVITAPFITVQPPSRTVQAGQSSTFSVSAMGGSLKYQWRKNGTAIAGATQSIYSLSAIQSTNAGSYTVVVSNPAGSVTSATAVLTVKFLVTTIAQGGGGINPTPNVSVNPGSSQTFTASPSANYTVGEWYLDGVRQQTGGTAYSISNIQANHAVKVVFRPLIKLYWQNTNGTALEWRFNGTNYLTSAALPTISSVWQMAGQNDFNGDGAMDLIYQNTAGQMVVWSMDGTSLVASNLVRNGEAPPSGWKLKALADFNSDGHSDFLFQTSTNLGVWLMNNGTNFSSSALLQSYNSGWRVVGMADFNGDGKKDILWQNSLGNVSVWLMNGQTKIGAINLFNNATVAAGWGISALADVDFNGQKDIIAQNSKRQVQVWLMSRTNNIGTVLLRNGATNSPAWNLKGPK